MPNPLDSLKALGDQLRAQMQPVVGAKSDGLVGDDPAHLVRAVRTKTHAVGQLEHRSAVRQLCRRSAIGVAATRSAAPGAEDDRCLVILEHGRELLGRGPGLLVGEHDQRSIPDAVVVRILRRAEDVHAPVLPGERARRGAAYEPGRIAGGSKAAAAPVGAICQCFAPCRLRVRCPSQQIGAILPFGFLGEVSEGVAEVAPLFRPMLPANEAQALGPERPGRDNSDGGFGPFGAAAVIGDIHQKDRCARRLQGAHPLFQRSRHAPICPGQHLVLAFVVARLVLANRKFMDRCVAQRGIALRHENADAKDPDPGSGDVDDAGVERVGRGRRQRGIAGQGLRRACVVLTRVIADRPAQVGRRSGRRARAGGRGGFRLGPIDFHVTVTELLRQPVENGHRLCLRLGAV